MNPNLLIVLFWLVVSIAGVTGVGNVILTERLRASVVLEYAKRKGLTPDELDARMDYVGRTMRSLTGRLLLNVSSAILSLYALLFSPNLRSPELNPGTLLFAVLLIGPCLFYDWATWEDIRSQNRQVRKAMTERKKDDAKDPPLHTI